MKLKLSFVLSILLVVSIAFIHNRNTTEESPEVEVTNIIIEDSMDKPIHDANIIDKDNSQIEDNSLQEDKFDYLKDTSYEDAEGKLIVKNTEDILVLVNKKRNLPSDHKPTDLVIPNVKFPFEEHLEKKYLRKEAAEALEDLFEEAKKDGLTIYAVSGYRSYNTQNMLFNNKANKVGIEEANLVVAFPGQSEHQTGLAMDVSSQSVKFDLTKDFGQVPEGKWLKDNAHKAGFIIRYKEGTTDITGYVYEPWHLRYVGKDIAGEIYELDITLEEFLGAMDNED